MNTSKKVKTASAGASTVVVKLNSPHSIYFDIDEKTRVKVNGTAEELRGKNGIIIPGHFGETVLEKSDWEAISRKYASMTIFQKGYIFAMDKQDDANAKASELKGQRHGLEPVDVKKQRTRKAAA